MTARAVALSGRSRRLPGAATGSGAEKERLNRLSIAKMAEIVGARQEAENELAYYDSVSDSLTRPLVDIIYRLPGLLKRDLSGLSPVDKETIVKYEELYGSLSQIEGEAWERLPIRTLFDIAEKYLPGIQK